MITIMIILTITTITIVIITPELLRAWVIILIYKFTNFIDRINVFFVFFIVSVKHNVWSCICLLRGARGCPAQRHARRPPQRHLRERRGARPGGREVGTCGCAVVKYHTGGAVYRCRVALQCVCACACAVWPHSPKWASSWLSLFFDSSSRRVPKQHSPTASRLATSVCMASALRNTEGFRSMLLSAQSGFLSHGRPFHVARIR